MTKARLARRPVDSEQPVAPRSDLGEIWLPSGPTLDQPALRVIELSYTGSRGPIVSELSFELPPGAILGVIGPAGSGKTTLLDLFAGRRAPDHGQVEPGPTTMQTAPQAGVGFAADGGGARR
jgi:sulfate-transporting ATPase